MADSGVISRLLNLWKGFVSLWISDVEKDHPEIAYENAINSMIEKYSKLKSATAAIIRRREDLDARVSQATKDLAQTEAELNTAVDTHQDDLAVVLIQKKNQLTQDLADMRGDLDTAQKDAASAKSSILNVQAEIRKLKAERDLMLARMQSAQARLQDSRSARGAFARCRSQGARHGARAHQEHDRAGQSRRRAVVVVARLEARGAQEPDR